VDRALIRIAGWAGRLRQRPAIDQLEVNAEAGGVAKLVKAIQAAKDAGILQGSSITTATWT